MAESVVKEIGKELLLCAVCMDTYKDPRILPCVHSFCKRCLDESFRGKCLRTLACPMCRQRVELPPSGVEGLPSNFLLQNLQEKLEKVASSSSINEGASEKTSGNSDRSEINSNLTQKLMSAKCLNHPQSVMMYCKTCKKVVCLSCVSSNEHSGHQMMDVSEVLEQEERRDDAITKLQGGQEECQRVISEGLEAQEAIKKQADDMVRDIKSHSSNIIDKVKKDQTLLCNEVKIRHEAKVRAIEAIIENARKRKEKLRGKHQILLRRGSKMDNTLRDIDSVQTSLTGLSLEERDIQLGIEFEPQNGSLTIGTLRGRNGRVLEMRESSTSTSNEGSASSPDSADDNNDGEPQDDGHAVPCLTCQNVPPPPGPIHHPPPPPHWLPHHPPPGLHMRHRGGHRGWHHHPHPHHHPRRHGRGGHCH